MSIFESEIE